MSLRFIYGRAGSGKSCYCFNDMKKRIKEGFDKPLILIVPEQFSFQAENNMLNIVGERDSLQVQVLSFKRLAYRVFNEVGGITRKRMNLAGRCMLIYNILENIKDELKIFTTAASQQGFIDTISDSISEFKKYDITPMDLMKLSEYMEDNIILRDKLVDLSIIYNMFESKLHEGYIDSDDDLTMLNEKLSKSIYYDGAEIWLDEFSSFTPQQYKIIEKLMNKCSKVNVTLSSDYGNNNDTKDGTDLFSVTKNTEAKLISVAMENNISIDKPAILNERPYYRFKGSKELNFLEKNLMAFPYEVYKKPCEDIRIFKAVNTYSEIESTARDILSMCRDKGFRFNDIAVIGRNLDSYENIISAIFSEYDIPYFIDKTKDISGNLIVVLITSAIEIFNRNWSYEAVFRYLKTGLTDIDKDDIDILENYVLAAGIRGRGKWLYEDKWNYRLDNNFTPGEISEEELEILEKIHDIRKNVTKPFLNFYSKIKGRKTAKDLCSAVYEFLVEAGTGEKVELLVNKFKAEGMQELSREYSQIWNVVMETLDQVVEVMRDERVTIDRFIKVITIGFEERKMGIIPPTLDEVLVSSVERVKSHDIKILYIVGVNDGVFPKAISEEGILTDNDRAILRDKGIELAKDSKVKTFEEKFLVYKTFTIPSDYLRISYAIADFEGKTLRPSILIPRLKTLFTEIIEESDIIEKNTEEEIIEKIAAPVPAFNDLITVLRKNEDGEAKNLIWIEVYKWFKEKDQWKEKCLSIFSAMAYTNQVNMIKKEQVKKLYGDNMYFSVSRLEKYVECPFSYFVKYGLKAKERKIFKLNPPDLGTFMHGIVDEFSKHLEAEKIQWGDFDKAFCEAKVASIVDENVKKSSWFILNSSPRYEYLSERIKRVLTRTLMLIGEHIKRSGFKPVGYELSFQKGGDYPPIILELPTGEKVNLIGRIDRIDVMMKEGETYLRIIDYKSGNKVFKLSEAYYGLQVQLLMYLDAILTDENEDMDKNMFPGGILYFKMDDPLIKSKKKLTDEEIEKEIMKKLKMNGLILADVDIVKEMDREMEGNSLIIPARINKGNVLGKSSVATNEQFDLLRYHVNKKAIDTSTEMLNGNIRIKPYKKKDKMPCSYCEYSAICQFDPLMKDNEYTQIKEISDEEVWNLLKKEKEGEKRDNGEN